ncbi:MAG: amidase [Hyphomicrobiales bacterium]|nr:amidase [Hyphomicrobiales bacterium]
MLLGADPVRAFVPYPATSVSGAASGALGSLTFGVKDLFDVEGYPTACGNPVKLAESRVATASAPTVQRLLDLGALFVGKTHTEELAWSLYGTNAHFGTPVNPAAPDRVPGGSSSGSASAVAAGLCDFALGTDTGGSVRAPASFCGLYGLRPTHGAISLAGCMPLAPSLDTCGFFARTIETFAVVGHALLPPAGVRGDRVMIAGDLFAMLPDATRTALAEPLERVQRVLGPATEAAVYDRPLQEIYDSFRFIQAHEAWSLHGGWYESRRPVLGKHVAERIEYARTVTDAQFAAARKTRDSFAAHLHGLYADGGVMIAPVLHGPAPKLDSAASALEAYRNEAMAFLCPAGLAGLPQLVIPAGLADGAPIGLSLVGGRGADRALIALAARLAAA